MNRIFVDTAGWMACADAADPTHVQSVVARDRALRAGQHLCSTDFVADETLTLLRVRLGLPAAESWWRSVSRSPRLQWERITASRFDLGLSLFLQHRDKDYSFTDCISFAVMTELQISHSLTTDHHFAQMGFAILPSPPRRRIR